VLAAGVFPSWHDLWHPLEGLGYQFWSGIGSDFGQVTLITGLALVFIKALRVYRKHTECHVDGCSQHGHVVHGTPYRACDLHDPRITHEPGEPITAEHIATAHRASLA
jgi:hypothetical protein